MIQFHSSGKLGDIIYTLPIVRKLAAENGGSEYVCNGGGSLRTFFISQPYINIGADPGSVDLGPDWINFDRACYLPEWTHEHFIKSYSRIAGIPADLSPWIEGYNTTPNGYAVINVTPRYRDRFFSWKSEVSRLKGKYRDVYFVGSREEFASFPWRFDLKYQCTTDVKELCTVIAGANEFSGTQSLALALRQGLGLPYRFEQSPNHEDVTHPLGVPLNPVTRKLHLLAATLKQILSKG